MWRDRSRVRLRDAEIADLMAPLPRVVICAPWLCVVEQAALDL